MSKFQLNLPDSKKIREHIIESLMPYWNSDSLSILNLPIKTLPKIKIRIPLKLISISLPLWAQDYGINGRLLVPIELVQDFKNKGDSYTWEDIDWFLASFLMLECWHERIWEKKFGPIHSYSFKLKNWDKRVWDHAWVNRIAMFLVAWKIHLKKENPYQSQYNNMKVKINLTHDVDAVRKTNAIRIKQSIFKLLNAIKLLRKLKLKDSKEKFEESIKFFLSNDDWWVFDKLLSYQELNDIKAIYYLFGIQKNRGFISWLFDPCYDISSKKIKLLVEKIKNKGHIIGLHPGFNSWNKWKEIYNQKKFVDSSVNYDLKKCRQHWLRFSWADTWLSQNAAGFEHDSTLMFNDRPGFRNSAAIAWHPWNNVNHRTHKIIAEPTIFMDSHFYDYNQFSEKGRRDIMYKYIYECRFISGTASILWHPHSLSKDYGWEKGYYDCIKLVKKYS